MHEVEWSQEYWTWGKGGVTGRNVVYCLLVIACLLFACLYGAFIREVVRGSWGMKARVWNGWCVRKVDMFVRVSMCEWNGEKDMHTREHM